MIVLDPDPRYVPPDDEVEERAVLLARARRAKLAQWTAFLVGIVLGMFAAIVIVVATVIAAPHG